MDDISLFLSKETVEKRKYLKDFFKKIELSKKLNKNTTKNKVSAYRIGMTEDRKFWEELYEDYKLPEEKCPRKYIRIGSEYQLELN